MNQFVDHLVPDPGPAYPFRVRLSSAGRFAIQPVPVQSGRHGTLVWVTWKASERTMDLSQVHDAFFPFVAAISQIWEPSRGYG